MYCEQLFPSLSVENRLDVSIIIGWRKTFSKKNCQQRHDSFKNIVLCRVFLLGGHKLLRQVADDEDGASPEMF